MLFPSPIFLFFFLPAVLFLYFLVPKKLSNLTLLLISLIFYTWGEGKFIVVILISIIVNYFLGILIEKRNRVILTAGIIFNLSLLLFFKYRYFHFPLGISFFTFYALSYIVDVYRGNIDSQKNPINLALYISFFPKVINGPIVQYRDIALQFKKREITIETFSAGIKRFIIGLGKKILIANTLAPVADQIFAIPVDKLSTSLAWLGILCFSLQIYFDFSGYSDMAIGLGKMFGFTFLENFNYPYISSSITDFWRRWHISLYKWLQNYLYIPLGGNRKGKIRTYTNILIVFLLCGLWHGKDWNFVVWGLWYGIFLVIEKMIPSVSSGSSWRLIRHLYALLVIVIGWVIFRSKSLAYAFGFLKVMFVYVSDNSREFYTILYLNNKLIFVILLGILFSFPIYSYLKKIYLASVEIRKGFLPSTLNTAISFGYIISFVIIFVFCSASSASQTYNPFIYFKF